MVMNDLLKTRIKESAVTSYRPCQIYNHQRAQIVTLAIELTIGSLKVILEYKDLETRNSDMSILDKTVK